MDILGYAKDGTKVNVEMQVANEYNMKQRSLYYWAQIYTDLKKGEEYRELKRTVAINILNYNLLSSQEYHSMHGLYNIKNGNQLTADLEMHFIEIPKWPYLNLKKMKRLDRWLAYFSGKISAEEMEAIGMEEPEIKRQWNWRVSLRKTRSPGGNISNVKRPSWLIVPI